MCLSSIGWLSHKKLILTFHNFSHLLLAGIRVGVNLIILPSLDDLLGLLAGEQQLPDHAHRPVQEVAVAAVLTGPSAVPVLTREESEVNLTNWFSIHLKGNSSKRGLKSRFKKRKAIIDIF